MIKPQTLWNFLKTCTDTDTVGRVCRTLGRQSVPLAPAEQLLVEMINNDSSWMDENAVARKERDRIRKAEARKRAKVSALCPSCPTESAESAESADSADSVHIHPSIHPSIHPNINSVSECETHSPARAPGSVPTEDQVVSVATGVMMVPEHYARWWYREMVGRGWSNTDRSTVDGSNWRPTLKAWYKRATPAELSEANEMAAKTPKSRSYAPSEWDLCAERCSNLVTEQNGCRRCGLGCKIPPQLRQYPVPPEACLDFKGLN